MYIKSKARQTNTRNGLRRTCFLAGVIALITVGAVPLPKQIQSTAHAGIFDFSLSDFVARKLIARQALYRTYANYYPDEIDGLLDETMRLINANEDEDDQSAALIKMHVDFRLKKAPTARLAPDATLKEVLTLQIKQLERAEGLSDGAAKCRHIFSKGVHTLDEQSLGHLDDVLFEIVDLNFKAASQGAASLGAANPVERREETDADWERFWDTFVAMGGDRTDMQRIKSETDVELVSCKSAKLFYKAFIDGRYEGADIMRAMLVDYILRSQ